MTSESNTPLYDQILRDPVRRKRIRQEELILAVTEGLIGAMADQDIKRSDLAKKLGKTKGFITQLFSSGRNLTLRTVADVAEALDCQVHVTVKPRSATCSIAAPLRIKKWNRVRSTESPWLSKSTALQYSFESYATLIARNASAIKRSAIDFDSMFVCNRPSGGLVSSKLFSSPSTRIKLVGAGQSVVIP